MRKLDEFNEIYAKIIAEENSFQISKKTSPYYNHLDFFNGNITPTLKIIKKFKTYQQSTDFTCGAASLLMVLNHWNIVDKNELDLAKEMGICSFDDTEKGFYKCYPAAIEIAVKNRGIKTVPQQKFETPESFAEFVKKQIMVDSPILVEWCTWGGHWTVIIGFDDMGTTDVSNYVLIMADPYDTTDHCQDGYVIVPFEKFFYEWFDAGVLSPGIIRQQYVAPLKPEI